MRHTSIILKIRLKVSVESYIELRELIGVLGDAQSPYYMIVSVPLVTYAAVVWFSNVGKVAFKRKLISLQRFMLLTITRCCRTVSSEALQVMAGKLPLDLVVALAALGAKIKRNEESSCLGVVLRRRHGSSVEIYNSGLSEKKRIVKEFALQWQSRWNDAVNGRVTFEFLPDVNLVNTVVRPWLWPKLAASFFMTGHGPFKSNLKRLGIVNDDMCFCGLEETWRHVLFECEIYNDIRNRYRSLLFTNTLNDLIVNENSFLLFSNLAEQLIGRRRILEQMENHS